MDTFVNEANQHFYNSVRAVHHFDDSLWRRIAASYRLIDLSACACYSVCYQLRMTLQACPGNSVREYYQVCASFELRSNVGTSKLVPYVATPSLMHVPYSA